MTTTYDLALLTKLSFIFDSINEAHIQYNQGNNDSKSQSLKKIVQSYIYTQKRIFNKTTSENVWLIVNRIRLKNKMK